MILIIRPLIKILKYLFAAEPRCLGLETTFLGYSRSHQVHILYLNDI